jgi:hypothetical protein
MGRPAVDERSLTCFNNIYVGRKATREQKPTGQHLRCLKTKAYRLTVVNKYICIQNASKSEPTEELRAILQ